MKAKPVSFTTLLALVLFYSPTFAASTNQLAGAEFKLQNGDARLDAESALLAARILTPSAKPSPRINGPSVLELLGEGG